MPNLIPFLQSPEPFKQVVLVVTSAPAIRQAAEYLRFFLRRHGLADPHILTCEVDSHDLELTLTVSRRLLHDLAANQPGFRPVFNMTGGTKIMALAAYRLALEIGGQLLYLDSGRDRLLQLLPRQEVVPVEVQLTISDYLAAHGYDLLRHRSPVAPAWSAAARLLALSDPATVSRLVKQVNLDPARPFIPAGDAAWPLALALEGLLWQIRPDHNDQRLYLDRQANAEFFPGGGWLETYAYDCAMAVGQPLYEVRCGLAIRREIENELDVAFTWRHHLAVVSCKTGYKTDSAWLYDLNDRGRRLGSFTRKILVVNMDTTPATEFRKRAAQDNIRVLDAYDLPFLTARLAEVVQP